MYPAERHAAILAGVTDGGDLVVGELSARLGVTPETIRRDLATLEGRGLVRRHHGGAVLTERQPFELSLARRREGEHLERAAVARAVIGQLPDDGVVILDSGATTLEVASLIPTEQRLVVVTNSLPIAALLAGRPNLSVLSLPGTVRTVTQATVGPWTVERLAEINADVAVIGANGVGQVPGATTTTPEEAEVKRAMLRAADRSILAVTAMKFETTSFHRAARLDEFDLIVTDDGLTPLLAAQLVDAGNGLLIAETEATRSGSSAGPPRKPESHRIATVI